MSSVYVRVRVTICCILIIRITITLTLSGHSSEIKAAIVNYVKLKTNHSVVALLSLYISTKINIKIKSELCLLLAKAV